VLTWNSTPTLWLLASTWARIYELDALIPFRYSSCRSRNPWPPSGNVAIVEELSARRRRGGELNAELVDSANSAAWGHRQHRRIRDRSDVDGGSVNRGDTFAIDQRIVEGCDPAEIAIRDESHFSISQRDGPVNGVGHRLQGLTAAIDQRCGCD
jgi:hypothetical protein